MSKPIIGYNEHWETKTFYNKVSSGAFRIFKIGSDYYLFGLYSGNYRSMFKYNSSNNMWQKYDISGLTINDFSIFNLWTDGTTVYYSDINTSYNIQLALNMNTLEWTQKTWGNVSIKSGFNIWYDDIHNTVMYIEQGVVKEWINRSTDNWADMALNGWTTSDLEHVTGADFWCDRVTGDWYGSSPFASYKLASGTTTWVKVWTNGFKPSEGAEVWSDGINIYYSSGTDTNGQLIYDRTQDTWKEKTWTGPLTNIHGRFIENVPGHTYYYSNIIYEFNTTQDTFEESYITLSSSIFIDGRYVWTDGTDTYYSYQAAQYVLDKTTSTWEQKTWIGLTSFSGNRIWTDGTNTYHSSGSSHHVLDKATSTWTEKIWNGLTNFVSTYIWTDGTDIYYSEDTDQYVLNKATSTWEAKTWNGLTSFDGSRVWTDGTNIYYSSVTNHYVLNKATSTWLEKTWNGLATFDGNFIWADGTDIYYSNNTTQYVLDKATSTWSQKTWNGLTSFNGEYIWTDGESIYLNNQYTLVKEPIYGKELPKYLNEEGLEHVASKMKQVAIFETRTALDAALANHELTDYTIVMVRNDNL